MSGTVPPYAAARADYGGSHTTGNPGGAVVTSVRVDSPAWDAGIEAGMVVTSVDGVALTDMIEWLWHADGDAVALEVFDPADATTSACELERFPGEDWGLEFAGAVFDGMRTCVNACSFCFMAMLPPHMRGTLYIRDDDYRLSFLQGNFVTLTNMSEADVANVIEKQLSPMNVSVHAVSPEVRRRLMGKNAQRGMDVLEQLLAAGIEVHAQIVLCPGINDGEELTRTLRYFEEHPLITSVGIVPLGYTRFQKRFSSSYSDDPAAARRVIDQVAPFQMRARTRTGRSIFQLSDEFYLDAQLTVPPAGEYDGYPQFYDGIGMIRSFLDETDALLATDAARLRCIRDELAERGRHLLVVSGCAARETVARLVVHPALGGEVIAIENRYFGGNVDVTGLICGCDLLEQLPAALDDVMLFLPDIIFNADACTLDGYHRDDIERELGARGAHVVVCPTTPYSLVERIEDGLHAFDLPHESL